ncbi:hypothetical protein PILCRDRAFT_11543 [Piloderma croceum F 1598]|uniref:Uncharacterized protein n=1 Tax=Piloderma croceum (strain F 1598) TaxID=765440 RepID=A0A0C3FE14_PILCF|nr:hypothetical protein PILCRDRAFT_11543 [Piloderma croceum F 1598]
MHTILLLIKYSTCSDILTSDIHAEANKILCEIRYADQVSDYHSIVTVINHYADRLEFIRGQISVHDSGTENEEIDEEELPELVEAN